MHENKHTDRAKPPKDPTHVDEQGNVEEQRDQAKPLSRHTQPCCEKGVSWRDGGSVDRIHSTAETITELGRATSMERNRTMRTRTSATANVSKRAQENREQFPNKSTNRLPARERMIP